MNNDIEIRIDDDRNIDVDMSNELIEKVVVQADWNENNPNNEGYIKNKPNLSNVATSGDYEDLSNKPTIPTKTSDLTNDSDFVDSNYVNGKIDDLKWELGANDLSLQTDTTTAYTKTVPIGAIGCKLNKLGFMSYKSNNILPTDKISSNVSFSNDIMSITNSTSGMNILDSISLPAGTYVFSFILKTSGLEQTHSFTGYKNTTDTPFTVFSNLNTYNVGEVHTATLVLTETTNVFIKQWQTGSETYSFQLWINKDTAKDYNTYFTGIRDSVITSIKSYDSNNNLIDTYTIPSEIQALSGYGRGINENCYNVLNLETKEFTDKDNRITFNGTENWQRSDTNDTTTKGYYFYIEVSDCVTVSGGSDVSDITATNFNAGSPNSIYGGAQTGGPYISYWTGSNHRICIYDRDNLAFKTVAEFKQWLADKYTNGNPIVVNYKLATYNTTNVSQYITNNVIEVEAGGYLVFENQYGQAVPSDITYLIEVAK